MEVAKRWVEAGNEVTLFASEFDKCKHEEILDGVRVVRRGGRFGVYRWAKKSYKERFLNEGFDVVVDEINTRPFFAPQFVGGKVKTVALIHQLAREYWFYETRFPLSYVGYHFLENKWLNSYVNVPTITVSESTKKDLATLGFRQIAVIPEGLNFKTLETIPPKEIYPAILFVGRLRRAKRPDHAIRAFSIVREKIPDAELWIIGDGSFREELERMTVEGVRILGKLKDIEKRELMERSWVLINPSVREGWGLNVLEANALGVPCVAYDVPGLRDSILDEETGLLAESGNVRELSEKVVRVLGDSSFRERLASKALEHSKHFSWDNTAKRFMEFLVKTIHEE